MVSNCYRFIKDNKDNHYRFLRRALGLVVVREIVRAREIVIVIAIISSKYR